MRHALALVVAFFLASFAPAAHAGVILIAAQVDGDVVIAGGGTLNTGAWTQVEEMDPLVDFGRIKPSAPQGTILLGPGAATESDRYVSPENFMGPSVIGTGGESFADEGTGLFGLTFTAPRQLYVPDGYQSGTPLAAASIYEGETFGSLGLEVGEYIWSWGSGDTADSFRLNVIPEPGTAALLCLGLSGLHVMGRSRRRRRE